MSKESEEYLLEHIDAEDSLNFKSIARIMQAYADKVKLEHTIEALEKEERIAMDKYQSWLKENKGYVMNGFHIRAMAYKDLKEKYQKQLEQLKTK